MEQELVQLAQPSPLEGDWRHWLIRNIENGVVEQTLIDAAAREIRAAWTQRSEGLRRKSEAQGYNYALGPAPLAPIDGLIQLGNRKITVLKNMSQPRIVHYAKYYLKPNAKP